MVSYLRARAEGLGLKCTIGIMQRPERVLLLGIGGLIGEKGIIIGLGLIALFSIITVGQRIYYVIKQV